MGDVRRGTHAGCQFDAYLSLQLHAASASTKARTSILPVTAAEISPVRRSCKRSMARWASAVSSSNFGASRFRKSTMSVCSMGEQDDLAALGLLVVPALELCDGASSISALFLLTLALP